MTAYNPLVGPLVSVVIASDRVGKSLDDCLRSLTEQEDPPAFEVVVASAVEPAPCHRPLPLVWLAVEDRNPALRRNRAARQAEGALLAFLDDDAQATSNWLAAGARSLDRCSIAGGPDLLMSAAPYAERLSDLLLATPWIGSGVPAHEREPRGGPVKSAHDVALCNLFVRRETFEALGGFDETLGYISEDTDFVRRALESGLRVVLDPSVRVRHRRRPFPGEYLAQRWRYRIKTGRMLLERPGVHERGRIVLFLCGGFLFTAGAALFGPAFAAPALLFYAAATWAFSFPLWRHDLLLFPAVPFAFLLHHAVYFAGLLVGMARGAVTLLRAGRPQAAQTRSDT